MIKLTIPYFFFFIFLFDGYKVEWQWKLLLQNRSSRPSTLPDSGVTSTLTLGSPLQQWLKFAYTVLQIRQEAFLISSAGSRPWDTIRQGGGDSHQGKFGLKIRRRCPRAPPLDPPLISFSNKPTSHWQILWQMITTYQIYFSARFSYRWSQRSSTPAEHDIGLGYII